MHKAGLKEKLARVAQGKEPAELMLAGGGVLNVYTGELLEQHQVLISDGYIAYVGPEDDFPPPGKTIDVCGQVVIPGMIEGHTHFDIWLSLSEYVRWTLPRGTTAVITECTATANALGLRGVESFLEQFERLPQRLYATLPMISHLCAWRGEGKTAIGPDELRVLLRRPEMVGLGEIYWSRLLNGAGDDLFALMEEAKLLGLAVEGHGAGARGKKLCGFAACGVDACHEPITADEVRERLRMGLYAMIREGSIRRELEAVVKPLVEMKIDLRRAILVSDGVWPRDLVNLGHLDYIVQKAINLGLDPVQAIRMVTLNVAEHFRLDNLGAVAPGKAADLVVIPALDKIDARLVILRGRVAAQDGALLEEVPRPEYPQAVFRTVSLPRTGPESFIVPAEGREVKVRAMEMITSIVNREITLNLPVEDGKVSISGLSDVLKAAVIDRTTASGRKAAGFLKGFGLARGALAASFGFDEGNVIVIGASDSDMALAVNRVRASGGGLALVVDGVVIEEVEFPLYGCVSRQTAPEMAGRIGALESALAREGCKMDNPLLTLLTLTFTAIPSLRLLSRGYWLARENRLAELFI